jgi:thiamine-phosphate pyrophosphorylase
MLQIAITQPFAVDGEDAIIRHLLANGFDIVHLRKPDTGIEYCRDLLGRLTPAERARIVVHDYATLYDEYALRGIHLNNSYTAYPPHYQGTRTRSCHSFEEVARYKDECDYLFLSPIFDSISKQGYLSKFSHDELQQASNEGIIDNKVIALGGVTPERIEYLQSLHFGGAAMMGAIGLTTPSL